MKNLFLMLACMTMIACSGNKNVENQVSYEKAEKTLPIPGTNLFAQSSSYSFGSQENSVHGDFIIVDKDGNTVDATEYTFVELEKCGLLSAIIREENGSGVGYHLLLDKNWKTILKAKHIESDRYSPKFRLVELEDGQFTYMKDYQLLPQRFEKARAFEYGAPIFDMDGHRVEWLYEKGSSEQGFAEVTINGKRNFIDENMNFIFPKEKACKYKELYKGRIPLTSPYAIVKNEDGYYGLYNLKTKREDYDCRYASIDDGVEAIYFKNVAGDILKKIDY